MLLLQIAVPGWKDLEIFDEQEKVRQRHAATAFERVPENFQVFGMVYAWQHLSACNGRYFFDHKILIRDYFG